MAIIPPPPYPLVDGTLAYGSQVIADINNITTAVNTNAAANGANSDITSLSALTTVAVSGTTNTGGLVFTGSITPPTLTANVANYAPIGVIGASTLRLAASTFVQISGLLAQPSGTLLSVRNVGAQTIRLTALDSASLATNQFNFQVVGGAGYLDLPPQGAVLLSYDGGQSQWGLVNTTAPSMPLPNKATGKRQIVLTGPFDSNGTPIFWSSTYPSLTLSFSLTTASPLIASAAQGFTNFGGANDVLGVFSSLPNITFPASSTSYVYLNVATGVVFYTASPPVYQLGGTASTGLNQFTFIVRSMAAYLGNGTDAVMTPVVCLGFVITGTGTITQATPYAYDGESFTAPTAFTLTTVYAAAFAHNLGVPPQFYDSNIEFIFTTGYSGYYTGARLNANEAQSGNYHNLIASKQDSNTCIISSASISYCVFTPAYGGTDTYAVAANLAMQCHARRNF